MNQRTKEIMEELVRLQNPNPSKYRKGTPQTLDEAIKNGLTEAMDKYGMIQWEQLQDILKMHVKDYLAQKFGALMLKESEGGCMLLDHTWRQIFPKDK